MPDPMPLSQTLQAIIDQHRGNVALFAENLKSGETVGIHEDEAVQTASVIKLAILYEAMQQVRAGEASLDDPIVMRRVDQVPRSGVLLFFDTPMTLKLKDALTMMIAMSDNTATNLVIDHIGLARINAGIQKLGLKNTYLYRKIFQLPQEPVPDDYQFFGTGKTTPREMAKLMQKIVECDLAETGAPSGSDDLYLRNIMLYMLRNQFYRGGIPRYLPALYSDTDSAIANKTGELDAVRNDVAAIETHQGTMILSIFTFNNQDHSWSVDNEGEITIAKLARAIVAAWSPKSCGTSMLQIPNQEK